MPDTVPAPEIEPPAATSMLAARRVAWVPPSVTWPWAPTASVPLVANNAPSSVPWPTIIWPVPEPLPTAASP